MVAALGRTCSVVAALVLAASSASVGATASADVGQPQAVPELRQLVDELIELLRENYVLVERLQPIEGRLTRALADGAYDGLAADALAARLTADLRAASGDLHFGIRRRPPPTTEKPGGGSTSSEARGSAASGIGRSETLAGNVGYLEITGFVDPQLAAAAADAAFVELAATDALIVDLRRSRGGHPAMVAYLVSYFFGGEPFVFNRITWRNSGRVLEFATRDSLPAPRYLDRPVYLLTSAATPSAAEGFAYHLQQLDRATVVGERTAGAAHTYQVFDLGQFQLAVPTGRPQSAVTGDNWEGSGVAPDVAVAAGEALSVAHVTALERLIEEAGEQKRQQLEAALGRLEESR